MAFFAVVAFVWFAVYSRDFGCACVRVSSIRQFGPRTHPSHTHTHTYPHPHPHTAGQMEKKAKNVDEILSSVLVANYLRCVCVQSFRGNFYQTKRILDFGLFIRFVGHNQNRKILATRWRRNVSIQMRTVAVVGHAVFDPAIVEHVRLHARVAQETGWRLHLSQLMRQSRSSIDRMCGVSYLCSERTSPTNAYPLSLSLHTNWAI